MPLSILHRKAGSVTIMDVSGRIVVGEAVKQLLDSTTELIAKGERDILLNLAGVAYVDSSGLGALVRCQQSALASKGRLKLLNVTGTIRDLLRITHLQKLFEIFDDESAALDSYR